MLEFGVRELFRHPEFVTVEHFRDLQTRWQRINDRKYGRGNFATYALLDALGEWGAIPKDSNSSSLSSHGAEPLFSVSLRGINRSWLPEVFAYAKKLAEKLKLEVVVHHGLPWGKPGEPLTESIETDLLKEDSPICRQLNSIGFRSKTPDKQSSFT